MLVEDVSVLEPLIDPARDPVMVPALEPVIVPTRDPVIVPTLFDRDPLIVPPKVTTERDSVSAVAMRVCSKRLMSFSPSELRGLLGNTARMGR
jgi:hypothetical protein